METLEEVKKFAKDNIGKTVLFVHDRGIEVSGSVVGYKGGCILVAMNNDLGWELNDEYKGTILLSYHNMSYWHLFINEILRMTNNR